MKALKSEIYKGVIINYRTVENVGTIAEAEGFGHIVAPTKKLASKEMKSNISSIIKWESRPPTKIRGNEAMMEREWKKSY